MSGITAGNEMQVEQYGEEYQSQSWGPLIALVKSSSPPGGGAVTSAKDRATIKETLLTVNGYIQVHSTPASAYLVA